MLIGRDDAGQTRAIDLRGLTIELAIPAPKADGGTADLTRRLAESEQRLAEAREGLEFYADAESYKRKGRGKTNIENDAGAIARDTIKAIIGSEDSKT